MKEGLKMAGGSESLVVVSRTKWLEASAKASSLASEVFNEDRHYGDQQARLEDEGRVQSARLEAERLFREYSDLERRDLESKMVALQRSQRLATWASFTVAAVVGIATILKTVIDLLK
jgi:hypothetical protein